MTCGAPEHLNLRRAVLHLLESVAVGVLVQLVDAGVVPVQAAVALELHKLVALARNPLADLEPPEELVHIVCADVRVGLLAQNEVEQLVVVGVRLDLLPVAGVDVEALLQPADLQGFAQCVEAMVAIKDHLAVRGLLKHSDRTGTAQTPETQAS